MFSFVYPGQGSQSPGMGKFLFDEFKEAKEVFEEASDALNFDMKKLCFTGSEADLALTENTQPAILTVSIASSKVLKALYNIKPSYGAGHSVGEYPALVDAGVLKLSDAVKSVRFRGQVMQQAVPVGQGSMAALLGADGTDAAIICEHINSKLGKSLEAANYNSPGQIVLSGKSEGVALLKSLNLKEAVGIEKRIKVIELNVSAPFHCFLMKPAEDKMRDFLSSVIFQDALYPVVQNKVALPVTSKTELKENLIRQISGSVLWQQSIEKIKSLGGQKYIEVGSGKVLNGLIKKIDGDASLFCTNSLEDIKNIESALKASSH